MTYLPTDRSFIERAYGGRQTLQLVHQAGILSAQYFTCVHCGGLMRLVVDAGRLGPPRVEVVLEASRPCPHPRWDEAGLIYRAVEPGEVDAILAKHRSNTKTNRSGPADAPHGIQASPATLDKGGLDYLQALKLATFCPWLDERKFAVPDIVRDVIDKSN